jgi:small subunit ribosomal protein S7
MARRRRPEKREIVADPKFNNLDVSKFMNILMYDGKKSAAENIVYGAFDIIQRKSSKNPLEIFTEAVANTRPSVEVRSRRVGGATYQVPVEVRPDRARALSYRWLVGASRNRGEKSMIEKLAAELLDAANNRGASVKKREDTHRMAEANRAFAHYRW